MKLTIDITDEMYQAVKNGTWCGSVEIANGTPLTEVLEDIKTDIEGLKHEHTDVSGYRWWDNAIDNALSIIGRYINGERGEKCM